MLKIISAERIRILVTIQSNGFTSHGLLWPSITKTKTKTQDIKTPKPTNELNKLGTYSWKMSV